MQIVIDIDENVFTRVFDNGVDTSSEDRDAIDRAVRNGTVLPKGHGRLIDADKILYFRCSSNVLDCPKSYDFICQHCEYGVASKFRIDEMTTIIEADNSEVD